MNRNNQDVTLISIGGAFGGSSPLLDVLKPTRKNTLKFEIMKIQKLV